MSEVDPTRILIVVVGIVLGYATGRYLWQRRSTALSPWIVIAIVAIAALVTGRLFAALGSDVLWQVAVLPLVVGWGCGLSVTRARPPLRSPWWQVWRL